MTVGVKVLNLAVIGPFVRHVEGSSDGAAVRVGAASFEEVLVEAFVQVVDGVVEGEKHNLWHLFNRKVA